MQRRTFTPEFRLRVVREALEAGNNTVVARRHELHPSMVNKWVRNYSKNGEEGLSGRRRKPGERSDHNLDVNEVQRENETLKKLLGEKDLEIAILRDLVKKGTQRRLNG